MKTVSEIRSAKNELNRSLFYKVNDSSDLFKHKMNELISKTPTGDLRNAYTDLNILFQSIESDYESLIKLHQI